MEDRFRKISSITSAEITPPILLRRRLSAPETIMRKHTLAQQRSSSQDSDRSSDSTQSCNWPLDAGSDPNLTRRRETDIRKSTLMKRFWESSKNLQFPRTYSEWQYSFGKMKLGSNHSTPEHRGSRKSVFELSPKHRRISPSENINSSPKRKISVYSGNYSDQMKKKEESPKHARKFSPKPEVITPVENDDSYIIYSSNFSNVTETVSNTSLSETNTTPTIHSDSAYTNTYSSINPVSTPENNNETIKAYEINANSIQSVNKIDKLPDLPIKYQFVIRENNNNDSPKTFEFIPTEQKSSSTQTNETTNLNVISNVQLSQSTLNLIFNKVMQDVLQTKQEVEPQPHLINVQNLPSFHPEIKVEEPVKKSLSQVNAGSPYKSKESPSVPRLSALPRTTSMEVNISSNESFDKESDAGSLVDSLEDPSSPKEGKVSHDEKLVRGELALLPDNSDNPKPTNPPPKKSSVFYIPIQNDDLKAIKEESTPETVSSLLPDKLKERLLKRQLKREEKKKGNRMRSFEKIDGENGNIHPYFDSSSDTSNKPRNKKKKTTLPLIDHKKDERNSHNPNTQRSLNRYRESTDNHHSKPKSFWLPRPRHNKLSPIDKEPSTSKKKDNKQIEILEIMEIVEPERMMHLTPKTRSKIPVPTYQKLPKITKDVKQAKPTFLDFEIAQGDPKLDQLIANILIDTLNHEDEGNVPKPNFDTIPEEKNSNVINNNPIIEKAAEYLTKQVLDNNNFDLVENLDEKNKLDNSKIPKGWITFYMLQKNNSPDSTSDEGPKINSSKFSKATQISPKAKKVKTKNAYTNYQSEDYFESDTDSEPKVYKPRKFKGTDNNEDWTVTVSGNNRGKRGPDVEMRLKFPQINDYRNKVFAKDKQQFFPSITEQNRNSTEPGFSFQELCDSRHSTEISKSKQYLKNCESTTHRSSVQPAKYEPRQTKTSKQRCLMHRSNNRSFFPIDSNTRNLQKILEKFPELLAINGNAMSKKNRQYLPKMADDEWSEFLSEFNNQNI